MTSATLPVPKRSGLPMLALVVSLLAMPFAIAAGLYFGGWKPAQTIQHGRLYLPPLPLPESGLSTPDGEAMATAELHGKWLLILEINGPCAAPCEQRIDEMRRIQVSLNKEMGRLRRVVLSESATDQALAAAVDRQPDLLRFVAPAGWLSGSTTDAAYRLHVVDPLGRRVMDYPAEVSAREVRSDLDRLLKFAWTG